jgi:acetyl esterase/lipase
MPRRWDNPEESSDRSAQWSSRGKDAMESMQSTDGPVGGPAADRGAQHDQASPHRPPSWWGWRLLGIGITILAVIVVLVWVVWLYPGAPAPDPVLLISLIASSLFLFLVVPAAVAMWLMVLAWRIGRRRLAGAAAVVSVLALLGVILPWATQARTAGQNNVSLSLSDYLASPDPGKPTDTVTYATLGGQQLQLDVWQAAHPAPGQPAVVWTHGGGWVSGDRAYNSLPKWGRWLADQGITMFSIDYRLPSQSIGMTPAADVKAQEIEDVKCALGWIEAHATDYSADAGDLALAGDSSGGHLAMLTAYTIGTPDLPPTCPVALAPVKAVVSLYGVTVQPQNEVSPIGHVRPGLPPTLLIQGTMDHVVPSDNAPKMAAQLASAGDQYRLVQLPFTDHVFDLSWGSLSTQIGRGVVRQFLRQYLE